jgi:FAD/FMN-containing dehydrogenase
MPGVPPLPPAHESPSAVAEQDRTLHQHILTQRQLVPQGGGHRPYGSSQNIVVLPSDSAAFAHQPADLVVTASAGLRLSELNQALRSHRQWIPLRPMDGLDDTLGGAVAAAVEGPYRGYGPFRDRIIGLTCVVPALGPINLGARVVKNVAGYNLPRILWGSRGTLGVITAITLKVSPLPEFQAVWRLPVTWAQLSGQIAQLQEMVPTWASLSLIWQEDHLTLYAVAHGRKVRLTALEEQLGPAHAADLPVISTEGPLLTIAGSIKRSSVIDFLTHWPSAAPVQVEVQSGTFFGYLMDLSDYHQLRTWMRGNGGALRVLRDDNAITPSPFVSDPWWQQLKSQFDPDGCLWDPRKG